MNESGSTVRPTRRLWLLLFIGCLACGMGFGFGLSTFVTLWNPPLGRVGIVAVLLMLLAGYLCVRFATALSRRGLRVNRWRRVRIVLTVFFAFVVGVVIRPALLLFVTHWNDNDERDPAEVGVVDDASRMNATRVAEVWDIPDDRAKAEAQLVALLKRARANGKKVAIAGARHSMGGHTVYPDGIVVNMLPFRRMTYDEETKLLSVQAGAKWSEIIPFLDERGRSVAVMQSNNSFSVGGSISVNCHGWQYDSPPIASTVESFRLLKADGSIVECSHQKNRELFSLALGGYGLFGVILDVKLRTVPNVRYRSRRFVVPVDASLETFDRTVRNKDAAMVYARLNIDPRHLFDEVVLNAYVEDADGEVSKLAPRKLNGLRRAVFRGSVGNNYGKWFRWFAETKLQPLIAKPFVSRNQLLNEGVEVFQNRTKASTDILHEYFVPRATIAGFLDDLRQVVEEHAADLLNVTVRSVNTDNDSFLRYADKHVFALVLLFNQPRTEEGERRMQDLTRALIEAALARGGRYYLPYRLHASKKQFHRAYPQAKRFFELKRKHDPDEVFQNRFYLNYGKQ